MITNQDILNIKVYANNVYSYTKPSEIKATVNAVRKIVKNAHDPYLSLIAKRTFETAVTTNGEGASRTLYDVEAEAEHARYLHRCDRIVKEADAGKTKRGVKYRLAFYVGNYDRLMKRQGNGNNEWHDPLDDTATTDKEQLCMGAIKYGTSKTSLDPSAFFTEAIMDDIERGLELMKKDPSIVKDEAIL